MLFGRPWVLLLAFFFLSSFAHGQDFRVGQTVAIAASSASVQSKQQNLGSVPHGTQFTIRQKSSTWLLGEFQIGNRTVLGWVETKTVHPVENDAAVVETHEFNWENLFLARVKLDKYYDFDAHVDDYLKTFREDVWKKYHDDEFQLHKKRAEALRIFKQRVEEFDLDQEFVITRATVHIEKYDFKHSAFPIKEATDHHYWYKTRYTHSDFPGNIKVFFENPELMKFLPMPAEEAERFLAARKDRSGNVDRELLAFIRIRVSKRKNAKGDELLTEIGGVKYYTTGKPKQFIYKTPDAPPEVSATPKVIESESDSSEGNAEPDSTSGDEK